MEKQFLTEFIEVYEQHPALWKVKSKEYVNKNLKNVGYNALIEVCKRFKFNTNRDGVAKKVQSLRSTFRKEFKKVENSRRSGSGSDEIYTPNLWYYELLLFTKDQEAPTHSITNLDSQQVGQEVEDYDENIIEDLQTIAEIEIDTLSQVNQETVVQGIPSTSKSSISASFITNRRNDAKRQRKEDDVERQNFLKVCTSALKEDNNKTADESDAFGSYVGKKLKSLKVESQKMFAETLITQVLQKAVLNTLTETTTLIDNNLSTISRIFIPDNIVQNTSGLLSPDSENSTFSTHGHDTYM